jgi:hypothetical protein
MNKKDIFKEIIRYFHYWKPVEIRNRRISLPLNSGKIITVSGVRRSGKTFVLFDSILNLLKRGVKISEIIYINFEDERLEIKKEEFDLILQAYQELYPDTELSKVYFFFDEIQNIDGWEKFVRRLYDTVSKNIFITGSNSKLISAEISTSLRGRNLNYEIYPLSFSEFLDFNNIKIDLYHSVTRAKIALKSEEYILNGGFPEIVFMKKDLRIKTLQEYFNLMLFKDLIDRYNLRAHTHLIKYFIKKLIEGISTPISIHKIYNELKSQNYKMDKNLLYELMEELKSIYFFFSVYKYSNSIIKKEISEKKIYIVDNGLINAISFNISENRGKLLENAVFMQMNSMDLEVFFYKNIKECDFILVKKNGKPEVYQVSYDLTYPETRKREFDGILDACRFFGFKKGTVITASEELETNYNGIFIKVVPFYKWALSETFDKN